ncbi:MAG: DUF4349 domain-containing protein [Defluviitaleaceae bacterium]|nr:DUF4349 domain-containing protein [Defluviitaleaceae bacterium]
MKRFTVITVGLLCAMIIFTACSPAQSPQPPAAQQVSPSPQMAAPSEPSAPAPQAAPPPTAPPPPPPAAQESVHTGTQVQADETYFPLPLLTPSEAGHRRLIYTVSMRLQTTEFMPEIRRLQNTVGELGGYLMFMEVWGHDMRSPHWERRAHFTFRIPTDNLNEFVIMVENHYNIQWYRQTTDDATTRYHQAELTLDDLRAEESWLIDEIEITEVSMHRTNLQRRLAEVRRQIRNSEVSQGVIRDNVIYSTVEIEFFEVIIPEEAEEAILEVTFNERVDDALSTSVGGLVGFIQGFVIFVILILPALIILGVFAGIALLIIRAVKRHNQKGDFTNSIDNEANFEIEDEKKDE